MKITFKPFEIKNDNHLNMLKISLNPIKQTSKFFECVKTFPLSKERSLDSTEITYTFILKDNILTIEYYLYINSGCSDDHTNYNVYTNQFVYESGVKDYFLNYFSLNE
jgi:hypothetical protein